jgi:hypothetical protein
VGCLAAIPSLGTSTNIKLLPRCCCICISSHNGRNRCDSFEPIQGYRYWCWHRRIIHLTRPSTSQHRPCRPRETRQDCIRKGCSVDHLAACRTDLRPVWYPRKDLQDYNSHHQGVQKMARRKAALLRWYDGVYEEAVRFYSFRVCLTCVCAVLTL